MKQHKNYCWNVELFEPPYGSYGMNCPDCVDEGNLDAWRRYLSRLVSEHLRPETMQTPEFQAEVKAAREEKEALLAYRERCDRKNELHRRRSSMQRPKIDFIPRGLKVDYEKEYAKFFRQVVTFMPQDKDDFTYMLRLLERWEKKSVPQVLAKGRPDAAYAIAFGLCEHLALLIERKDLHEYLTEYRQRIGKLILAGFTALVDAVRAWNNEEKRRFVVSYISDSLSCFEGFKSVQRKLQVLAPVQPLTGEPVAVVREMSKEEEYAVYLEECRRKGEERRRLEAEKEAKSLIPINADYESIFDPRNIDMDCDFIANLMQTEILNIKRLVKGRKYQEAALCFLQMTKSMCRHFIEDRHWEYFDDMYSPVYVINDLIELFNGLAQQGDLPASVMEFLHEAWKEIEDTECCKEYVTFSKRVLF